MISVAVYRVNKNRGYTVMANFHLRDKSLSLKAVGLLSKMLSFNDGWKFSTKGLSAICKEGPDAILSALRELEKHGYLVRHRQRDGKGRMSSTIFEIYEEPQESTPEREIPHTENPCVEKPDVDNPRGDKSAQINTDQVITQERNTLSKNYQSINLDGMDRMDERSEYEEIIKENLDYDILCQDPKFDKDRFREIMDIMLDAVCSTAPTIRINGEDKRDKYEEAHRAELALWDAASRYLHANLPEGTKGLPISEWKKEYAALKAQNETDYAKLKETRAEVAELQNIRKCVEIAQRADQPEQTQSRAKRHDLDR